MTRDGMKFVRGRGAYLADMRFRDLRHVKFKRAEGAHGTGLSVSRPTSLGATGALFYSADDLGIEDIVVPITRQGVLNPPRPALARAEHRFVGEPIAVVVAEDEYTAEDLVNEVSYTSQPAPPAMDPLRAAQDGAPLVHAALGSNVLFEESFRAGDETVFASDESLRTVSTTIRSGRVTAVPLETRGIVACGSSDGVTVWCSTQSPHMLRDLIAEHTGLSRSRVVVRVPDVGGGFGLKAHAYPEELVVAVLAHRLKANLRWVEDRVENLSAACHARDQHIRASAIVDNEGRIRGIDADIVVDIGAYGVYAHGHLLEALGTPAMVPGPYDLDFYRYRVRAVATNKAPLGAYRGVGLPVATLIHERLVEHVASALRRDSVELRRQNVIREGQSPYTSLTGQKYHNFDFETALARVTADIASHRDACERALDDDEWLVGQGFGLYIEYVASGSAVFKKRGMMGLAGFDEFELRLAEDGSLTMQTTLPSIGQGVVAATRQALRKLTGLEPEEIRLPNVDTGQAPLSGNGTFASRSAVVTHTGARQAYVDLVDSIAVGVCSAYGVERDAVEVHSDLSVDVRQDEPLHLPRAGVARVLEEKYRTGFARVDPQAPVHPSGAHGCLLAIHRHTARLRILRYTVADECGIRVDPEAAEGQVRGAVAQAISGALQEEILYDSSGQINNPSFVNYGLLTAAELPDIVHLPFVTKGSIEADEVKGTGEAGMLAPGATIANAVSDALGVPCDTLPIRKEWLLENLPAATTAKEG